MTFIRLLLIVVAACVFAPAQTKTVALTIDDLPYATMKGEQSEVADARRDIHAILEVLKAHKAPAVAFVNEAKIQYPGQMDARSALLDEWLDGGVPLGNHTFSHPDFNKTSLADFEAEVIRGEVITRRLMKARGLEYKYFRHPFLHTGKTLGDKNAFEDWLKQRGYVIAPVTLENLDWLYNTAYLQALKNSDAEAANRLLVAYVEQTSRDLDYYEKFTHEIFGREIAHVMLLHSNRVNALVLDQVLRAFEARGYKFVTLDEALKDPAYETASNYVGPYGSPWQHSWAITLGKKPDFENAPDPPKWVLDIYTEAIRSK